MCIPAFIVWILGGAVVAAVLVVAFIIILANGMGRG